MRPWWAWRIGGLKAAKGQEPSHQDTLNPAGVRPLGERSPYEKPYRVGSPTQGLTPLQDSYGIITPSDLHFYVNHEYGVIPVIDPKKYRLVIHGMVKRSVILTLDEIKLLPSVTRVYFIECNGNASLTRRRGAKTLQQSHGRTSCAEWTGVPLSLFLKEVGVQAEGTWVLAVSQDTANHAISIPMEKCMDDVLVAYAQNGEPMRLEQGYPLRLVVPGWGGRIHVKWLNQLKVVDQPYLTTQDRASHLEHTPAGEGVFFALSEQSRKYRYEMVTKSVITFPSGGHRLPGKGLYEITGLAWSGAGKVREWKSPQMTARPGRTPSCRSRCCPKRIRASGCPGSGMEKPPCCSPVLRMSLVTCSLPCRRWKRIGSRTAARPARTSSEKKTVARCLAEPIAP